jgi:hypothetical protein
MKEGGDIQSRKVVALKPDEVIEFFFFAVDLILPLALWS